MNYSGTLPSKCCNKVYPKHSPQQPPVCAVYNRWRTEFDVASQ